MWVGLGSGPPYMVMWSLSDGGRNRNVIYALASLRAPKFSLPNYPRVDYHVDPPDQKGEEAEEPTVCTPFMLDISSRFMLPFSLNHFVLMFGLDGSNRALHS